MIDPLPPAQSPKTIKLLEEQQLVKSESQEVKTQARSAMVILRDVLDAVRDTELDLARIIARPRE